MNKVGKSKPKSSKKLFKDKNIYIILNKDTDSIEFSFKKFISSEGFKKELSQVYDCFFEEGCKKALCDMRKMGAIPPEAQQWIDTTWMPRMIQLGVKTLAFVTPSSASVEYTIDQIREQRAEKEALAGVKTFFYSSIEAARDCLASMALEQEEE